MQNGGFPIAEQSGIFDFFERLKRQYSSVYISFWTKKRISMRGGLEMKTDFSFVIPIFWKSAGILNIRILRYSRLFRYSDIRELRNSRMSEYRNIRPFQYSDLPEIPEFGNIGIWRQLTIELFRYTRIRNIFQNSGITEKSGYS